MNNEEEFKETELGLLPKEWGVIKLSSYADVKSGGSAPQGEKYFSGKNPFIRVQHLDITTDKIKRYDLITDEAIKKYKLKLFPKETIVFPKSGASIYLEKRSMLPFSSYIVSHLCAINSSKEELIQKFLYFYLKYLKLSDKKTDSYPTLSLTEIKSLQIPLPLPQEQEKIAYVLLNVQDAKEKTQKLVNSLKELKKSTIKHLFSYGPVSFDDISNVELKETEIGFVPKNWKIEKLGELSKMIVPQRNKPKRFDGDVPWIRIEDFEGKYLTKSTSNQNVSNETIKNMNLRPYPIGTVLCSCSGNMGICAITKEVLITNQTFIGIVPNNYLNNEYLYYLLSSLRQRITSLGTGVTIHYVSKNKFKTFEIPLPSLPEQQQIAHILSSIDEKIEAEEKRVSALEQLFKSLLHNLMSGKIRVKNLQLPGVTNNLENNKKKV